MGWRPVERQKAQTLIFTRSGVILGQNRSNYRALFSPNTRLADESGKQENKVLLVMYRKFARRGR